MAVTNKIRVKGTNLTLKPALDIEIAEEYNVDTVSIVCMIDANVLVTGAVTKNEYIFHGAGAVQSVDIRDVDELLNKKRSRACCGGASGTSIFELK